MSFDYYLSLLNNEPKELQSLANEKARNLYGQTITYSRNFFVPITHQCRNRCGYCSFVSDDVKSWITPDSFQSLLKKAKSEKCSEILLTLGEKPEEKYETAREFLRRYSCNSTVDYVKMFCELALDENLLPHSNPGVITFEELKNLKDSNASLGLMLESSSTRLLDKDEAHYLSPTKDPKLRLEVIENAGRLRIPFTSGLLIGIGETKEERIESLLYLQNINKKYRHIQEIIIQNFNPQKGTPMQDYPPPEEEDVLLTIALSRMIMGSNVNIQAPPNLNRDRIITLLDYGANDLGGISSATIDYINPNMTWQEESNLGKNLESEGFFLKQRLPVYPPYEKYLNKKIRKIIEDKYRNEEIISPKNR
jgi:7,8-didemethyl-8-hydroxy-5-deazariboflavin synthase CofG subunit